MGVLGRIEAVGALLELPIVTSIMSIYIGALGSGVSLSNIILYIVLVVSVFWDGSWEFICVLRSDIYIGAVGENVRVGWIVLCPIETGKREFSGSRLWLLSLGWTLESSALSYQRISSNVCFPVLRLIGD